MRTEPEHGSSTAPPVQNPFSTGAGGVSFEHLVGASYLTALLAADVPRGLDWGVTTRVQFQQKWSGNALDDMTVTSSDAGRARRLAIQVKHELAFSGSDDTFKRVVKDCWDTFTSALGWDFNPDTDRLGIAVGVYHSKLEHLRTLTDWAKTCLSAAEFIDKVALVRFSSDEKREYLATFRRAISAAKGSAVTDEELWQFLKCLVVIHFDIEHSGASDSTYVWNRLMDLVEERNAGAAKTAFDLMVAEVGRLAPTAGAIDRPTLRRNLPHSVKLKDQPDFARDLARLRQESDNCLGGIRDSIGGKVRLPRESAVRSMLEAVRDHVVTVVTGEPMVGKSVLLRLVARSLRSEGQVIALAAEQLRGTSIASYLHELNVQGSLSDLLAAAGGAPLRCVLIDGLEKVIGHDERILVLKDLLRSVGVHNSALAADRVSASYQWRLLMTCRQREAEAILSDLDLGDISPSARTGIYNAPLLEEDELSVVTEAVPELAHIVTEVHLGELLRRPLVLDMLARPGVAGLQSGSTAKPSEAWLMRVFWRDVVRRGEGMLPGRGQPDAREQTMLSVARETIGLDSSQRDPDAIAGLVSDGLLTKEGSRIRFAHDAYEDWTLCRLLADYATRIPEFLKERGEPPKLTDAVRLYALKLLDVGNPRNGWKELLLSLEKAEGLSPRWQQAVLLAPLHSPDAESILDVVADMLLEGDSARLRRLLLWLRRTYTVPNDKVREWMPEVYDLYAPYFALPDRPRWRPALKFVLRRVDSLPDDCVVEFAAMAKEWMPLSEGDTPLRRDVAQAAMRLLGERYGSLFPRARLEHGKLEQLRKDLAMAALWGADILSDEVGRFVRSHALRDDANDVRGLEDTLLEHGWMPMCKYLPEETVDIYSKLLCEDPDRADLLNGGFNLSLHMGMNGEADMKWFPPTYMKGPFLGLLRLHPEHGLRLVHAVVNHATTCWRIVVAQQFGMKPVPQSLEVSGSVREVWGDASVYCWFRYPSNGEATATTALMALEHWLDGVVKADGDIPMLFERVLAGTESVAVVGVCASVARANPGLCAVAAIPILANPAAAGAGDCAGRAGLPKKSRRLAGAGSALKARLILEHQGRLSVRRKSQLAELPRSSFYASRNRPESQRERRNRYLLMFIMEVYKQSYHTYGSRRIHAELRGRRIRCSLNRVARLMKQHGIVAVQHRKYRPTTDSGHDFPVAPNLPGREFQAAAPSRVWVADITYIPTDEGWLYLATELDLYSHRIVGWSLGSRLVRHLVLDAIEMAAGRRRPGPGLIHHSDRGV